MVARAVLLAGMLLATVACERGPQVTMMHLAPPSDWEAVLLADRDRKDDFFAHAPDTPLLAEAVVDFEGLEYFPPEPDFYLVGHIERYPQPERVEIAATSGEPRKGEKIGWVSFELEGTAHRLQVYQMDDDPGFFLPFKDQTAGKETYPGGRYLQLDGPPGGPYVLDFNRAYNPYCAYGSPFSCPVTPRENHLEIAIGAGERGYKHGAPE